jgi:hypothetical protein
MSSISRGMTGSAPASTATFESIVATTLSAAFSLAAIANMRSTLSSETDFLEIARSLARIP